MEKLKIGDKMDTNKYTCHHCNTEYKYTSKEVYQMYEEGIKTILCEKCSKYFIFNPNFTSTSSHTDLEYPFSLQWYT